MNGGLGLILFGGLGYVLVYAAVANSGRFATHPWAGLQEDAYTGKRSTAAGPDQAPPASSSSSGTTSPGGTLTSTQSRPRHRRQQGKLV